MKQKHTKITPPPTQLTPPPPHTHTHPNKNIKENSRKQTTTTNNSGAKKVDKEYEGTKRYITNKLEVGSEEDVPVVEFMYFVFTGMPCESCRRRFISLLLYLCYVFRALIKSACWFRNRWAIRNRKKKQRKKAKKKKKSS